MPESTGPDVKPEKQSCIPHFDALWFCYCASLGQQIFKSPMEPSCSDLYGVRSAGVSDAELL